MTDGENAARGPSAFLLGVEQAVVIRIGGAELGIRIAEVREVSHVPAITRLPFPPRSVRGVASVRGAVIPVIDLGERLFGTPVQAAGRLVVVEDPASGAEIGLLVEFVAGLVSLEGESHAPPAEVEASLPDGWIAGVVTPEPDRLVTLLNLQPILDLYARDDEESR